MPQTRVTLLDVARHAGVSRTTASFVMNDRSGTRISPAAHERVRRAARELGYRPNLMARGLRSKLTGTIALVSDTIATEQYAGQVVKGSLAAALDREQMLFIGETEGDADVESRLIENFLDRQVDGFVYAAMWTREVQVPAQLRGYPLVLLNCIGDDERTTTVLPDELAAGRAVAEALLEAGHSSRVVLVGEPSPWILAARERVDGITDGLSAAGTSLAGSLPCAWAPGAAYDAVLDFLVAGGRPSAFVALNDRIALGVYQALATAELSVPADVSVVSFDGSELAGWLRPRLMSAELPHHELGRRAVSMLLAGEVDAGTQRVAMPLERAASLGPPAR